MNLDIQSRGFTLTQALASAVRRESAALDGVGGAQRLQVRLFDVNGSRGGIDKGCLVTLHLGGEKRAIVATDLDADLYRAIPAAFAKLRRALTAASRRQRTLRRRNPSPHSSA